MGPRARSPRTDLLRDVLLAAVEVARTRADDDPASVPVALRPVVGMHKLTGRALAAADRAGDDDAFRADVAAAVDGAATEVGEAGRLWLDRPDGWEDALDRLVAARAEVADEGAARRGLAREQRARARAETARDEAVAELARLREEADALRATHDALAAQARDDAERAAAARDERTRAVRELKGMEARHAQAHEELREARAARDAAEARAARRPVDAGDPAPPSSAPAPDHPAAGSGSSDRAPTPPRRPTGDAGGAEGFDRAGAGRAVLAAAGAAAALAASLADLATALGAPPPPAEPSGPAPPTGTAGATGTASRRGPRRTARPAPRRTVGRLPGGLHDDTPEAAAHLVRLPGCALLVDGYNASMATWPGRTLPEQRQRLVAALDEMEARVGVETTVVFDGVEERWSRSGSRRVHVHFTPAGIEADDVILGLVDLIADDRPVVVASNDRRVRDGARRLGAHTIGIDQLRALVT